MKIAVMTRFFTEWNMEIDTGHAAKLGAAVVAVCNYLLSDPILHGDEQALVAFQLLLLRYARVAEMFAGNDPGPMQRPGVLPGG